MHCSGRPRKAKSPCRVSCRGRHRRIDLVDQAIHGFEAGLRNLWASIRRRRPPQSRRAPVDDPWPMPIEIESLGGPIPDIRTEPMDLAPARPRRRRPEPAPMPKLKPPAGRAEPPPLRPDPAALRAELQVLRPEPQVLRPELPPAARELP